MSEMHDPEIAAEKNLSQGQTGIAMNVEPSHIGAVPELTLSPSLHHDDVLVNRVRVRQQMDAKYQAFAGALGAPTGELIAGTDGRYVRLYQHGMIASVPPSGAHVVYGGIYQKYQALGRASGMLGYPLSDETGTPDGVDRFNRFQNGMIYWTPQTGAHEIHGAILALWASLGYETSSLGYPLTDETAAPDGAGRYSTFQHGSIYWSSQSGAVVIPPAKPWNSGSIAFSDGTALGGSCQLTVNSNGDWTFSGHMHDSGFDTYDYAVVAVLLTPPAPTTRSPIRDVPKEPVLACPLAHRAATTTGLVLGTPLHCAIPGSRLPRPSLRSRSGRRICSPQVSPISFRRH